MKSSYCERIGRVVMAKGVVVGPGGTRQGKASILGSSL
jgi:hypothetical protein